MQITPNYWNNGRGIGAVIGRVYFGDLGYVQCLYTRRLRGTSRYYDRHRIAKGDYYDDDDSPSSISITGNLTADLLWPVLDSAFQKDIERTEENLWFYCVEAAGANAYSPKRPKKLEFPEIA